MGADAGLAEGARNAVRVCMGVQPSDRVLILTDDDTAEVGEALLREALATNASVESLRLEDFAGRPCLELPPAVHDRILSFLPSVTYLAVSAKPGEVKMRGEFIDAALKDAGARHAHMHTITPSIMREGMRVDYRKVNRLTTVVHDVLRHAKEVHVTSARGSDIIGRFSEHHKWVRFGGLYHKQGQWGNLPEGEVFTCPDSLDGTLVVDVIGDYFSPKYGILEEPVKVEFEGGYARKVTCPNQELEQELVAYLSAEENGSRAGEFAIGTNIGVKALCGILLQDEKIPGLHVGLGYPFGDLTGAAWSCETHVDLVPSACTIYVDGKLLLKDGSFTLDV